MAFLSFVKSDQKAFILYSVLNVFSPLPSVGQHIVQTCKITITLTITKSYSKIWSLYFPDFLPGCPIGVEHIYSISEFCANSLPLMWRILDIKGLVVFIGKTCLLNMNFITFKLCQLRQNYWMCLYMQKQNKSWNHCGYFHLLLHS